MTEKVRLQTKPNYLQIISRPIKNKKARLSCPEYQAFKVSHYHFSPPKKVAKSSVRNLCQLNPHAQAHAPPHASVALYLIHHWILFNTPFKNLVKDFFEFLKKHFCCGKQIGCQLFLR